MRRVVGLLVLVGAVSVPPAIARAQVPQVRFDIDSVGDSTFTFGIGVTHWVSPGQSGLAVDPAHSDELIAKFRVLAVKHGIATALVTGQTARLTKADVAILKSPRPAFFRQPVFWIGAVAGGIVGFVLHSL